MSVRKKMIVMTLRRVMTNHMVTRARAQKKDFMINAGTAKHVQVRIKQFNLRYLLRRIANQLPGYATH